MPEPIANIDYAKIRTQLKNDQKQDCLMTLYNYRIDLKKALERPQTRDQAFIVANHIINIQYIIDKINVDLTPIFAMNQLRWWEESYQDERLKKGVHVNARELLLKQLKMVIDCFLINHPPKIKAIAESILDQVDKLDLDLYNFIHNQTEIRPVILGAMQKINEELDVNFIMCNTKPITKVSIKPNLKIRISHK